MTIALPQVRGITYVNSEYALAKGPTGIWTAWGNGKTLDFELAGKSFDLFASMG
jgi:hypothetical protein